jgi:uncharacterized repeat protein (TIGR01451 family)
MVKPASLITAAALLALAPLRLWAAPDIALQMTVDTAVPAAGQPVQFTITASNVGLVAATGVQVTDTLPAELKIPAGTAAFPSTGTYDATTGVWSIGALAPAPRWWSRRSWSPFRSRPAASMWRA